MTLNLTWPLTGSDMDFTITSRVYLSTETGAGIPLADRIGSGERLACETVLSKIKEYGHPLEAPIRELISLIDATRSNQPLSAPSLKRKLELQEYLANAYKLKTALQTLSYLTLALHLKPPPPPNQS